MPRWPHPSPSVRQPDTCEVGVPLPTHPLMLAAGSRNSPAVTRSRVDILLRMSGRDLHRDPARRAPHRSSCRRIRPWTQIRLGAGTPQLSPSAAHLHQPKRGPHELNHNTFPPRPPPDSMRWPFVAVKVVRPRIRCGRSTLTPTTVHRPKTTGWNETKTRNQPFTGDPQHR
jgi:hypothetical protein